MKLLFVFNRLLWSDPEVSGHFPQPRVRARRRVETPPGAQAQADWGEFPRVLIAGQRQHVSAFVLKLSFSRFPALIWSPSKNQLAWHRVHNEGLRRIKKTGTDLFLANN